MSIMSTCDLRTKDVINLCDGAKLGKVSELEFDTCQGKILSFTVSRECGFFSFGKAPCITIPWCKIECIGEDTLLVRIPCSELPESFKTENKG